MVHKDVIQERQSRVRRARINNRAFSVPIHFWRGTRTYGNGGSSSHHKRPVCIGNGEGEILYDEFDLRRCHISDGLVIQPLVPERVDIDAEKTRTTFIFRF
ncbi:hypothetical protein ABFX02_08G178100 [Erythranthe guttata]